MQSKHFDVAALSRLLAPATRVQFLPSASLGPMGKPMDKAGLLSVMENGRSTMKDGRLPMEIIEVTDASAAGLIIAHTKSKGAFTVTGKPVTNEYSIIMWMDEVDGELKITRVREFLDSAVVQSLRG
ncbi:hypothetical protein EXIGLDRAFT_746007 [Exidia glandulosa HHB12029]|uniref:SnoaL-like domain-containing protein n=1 Tax=Exidia glandulosa HHB12029 TaxID=1314781 RepID=A0A165MU15_EXIGL|nr:hypothetical protein EXIGLDRAFT_746007 [Exidia glandulosa HHB12029]